MRLSKEILYITESQIDNSYRDKNIHLLEKECLFVMNNLALSLSEIYPNILLSIKPMNVKFKREPTMLFQEEYLKSLKNLLNLSKRIYQKPIDFNKVKLGFESWFYQVTCDGVLELDYGSEGSLSITEAAGELGVSHTMIYKYIDHGLETVGEKGSQKIPKFIIDAWKNPALAFKMQWIYQIKKSRTQTVEDRLESINKKIMEYEMKYKGTYHELFGTSSDLEIDIKEDAGDIFDWMEIEKVKRKLLSQFPCGD